MTLEVLKKRLVKASRVLENEGLVDHFGHVSVRIPGKDAFLIKAGLDIQCDPQGG